jgi:hypothetical protein
MTTPDLQMPGVPRIAARISQHFRGQRWAHFLQRFPDLPDMAVIDLGGYYWNWVSAPVTPKSLVVVNLDGRRFDDEPDWVETVTADACELPTSLFERNFDLVCSNSLLEHVGGYSRRQRVAQAVHQLAPHHWIQTPARSFPLEPHFLFPCFQFLPVQLRARLSRAWPFSPGHNQWTSWRDHLDSVLGIELVSATEMQYLFPGSELHRERVAGITKSLTMAR